MTFTFRRWRDETTQENIIEIRYTDRDIYGRKPEVVDQIAYHFAQLEEIIKETKR